MDARKLRVFTGDEQCEASAAPPDSTPYGTVSAGSTNDSSLRSILGAEDRRPRTGAPDIRWTSIPRWAPVCAALQPIFALLYGLGYWLRFEGPLDADHYRSLTITVFSVVLIKTLMFGWFRVYQGWNRYVTFPDLTALAKAVTASSLLILLTDYLLLRPFTPPRSVFLMDWGLTIVVIGGLRSLSRLIAERESPAFFSRSKLAFIAGANDSGETLLRAIRRSQQLPYRVVGFITEDPDKLGTQIAGVPVIGMLERTCELARQYGVHEVLLTAGELSGRGVRSLVEAARRANVEVKVLPSYEQLIHGTVNLRPREVSIEDLLRREPAELDVRGLHQWIDGRVVLVTGSAGSIGSEICRQLLQFSPQKLVLVDRSETGQFFLERELQKLGSPVQLEVCLADLLDRTRMEQLFQEHQPDVVFHAAAYKHVPLMEQHPGEGVKNIILATRQLADLAAEYACESFVMISTDKAVNPTSVMGACKRAAELYVQAQGRTAAGRFVTVRFGNVLDSAGSVVPIFRQQIAEGGPVTVTHPDMRRYFMTIPEAARLVLQAGAIGQGGHILLLDMGEPVRIVDLAEDMIRLSGLRVGEDVAIEFAGLRPGEKLFEELHLSGEQHLPTSHPKIIVVEHEPADLQLVTTAIRELVQLAQADSAEIPARLAQLVPEYRRGAPPALPVRKAA